MSLQAFHWENHLLAMANEALESHVPFVHDTPADQSALNEAYLTCAEITRRHSRTFYLASGLLPVGKRRAIRALYAFCRVSDDLVDQARTDTTLSTAARLEDWRSRTTCPRRDETDPVALAWSHARQSYQIPWRYADQLIGGVAMDLRQASYSTFTELSTYCYGVACTVGLMSMHIIGYAGAEAVPYAVRLGVALQMTNILRDVGEDARNGRVYLPEQELAAFGLGQADVKVGRVDGRWREFMRFQIERNRSLYADAWPGIALLDRDGRFAVGAAAELYQAILRDIENNDYNVFHRRASVSAGGKLGRLPGIWWR
ncbi:MAG TPA: phytoene/squalene synthase family protein, partial [Anaerolineales bacterium]